MAVEVGEEANIGEAVGEVAAAGMVDNRQKGRRRRIS